jgi:hypothetical protein
MRCDDLTRELASPTGALTSAQMAEHLAVCPACAEWSRRANQFERIWEETRPIEPSMDALDALWARASVEIDAAMTPATLEFARPNRRRRWGVVAFAAAQAAAVLVGALLLLDRGGNKPIQVADNTPAKAEPKEPVSIVLNVEPDVLTVVRIGKASGVRIDQDDMSSQYNSPTIPDESLKDLFDAAETMSSSSGVVASNQ